MSLNVGEFLKIRICFYKMERKIKILHILPMGQTGGAEYFVLSMLKHHDKNKFHSCVAILVCGGEISARMLKEGYYVKEFKMKNGFDFFKAVRLISFIRKNRFDIINFHGQVPLGKLFCILAFPPVFIHTDHGTSIYSPVSRKRRVIWFNRLITPFITSFVAISNAMKKSLEIREKVPAHKIKLIYNGVDVDAVCRINTDKALLKKSLGIKQGGLVMGTVGRLVPEKQYPLLLKSLAILKQKGFDYDFIIAGDGPQKKYLENLSIKLGIKEDVRFLGRRDDVISLLDIMDIFLFASGGEAFSIAVLEAMAKSRPIVAFDVEGVNEAVLHGKTGYLVPNGNVDEFAFKTEKLIRSGRLRKNMGCAGFERVSHLFDIKRNILEYEKLYFKLISKTGDWKIKYDSPA